jgi:hypothetical protein
LHEARMYFLLDRSPASTRYTKLVTTLSLGFKQWLVPAD